MFLLIEPPLTMMACQLFRCRQLQSSLPPAVSLTGYLMLAAVEFNLPRKDRGVNDVLMYTINANNVVIC